MNDKHRLSGEQALDDYFFDLLAEPEELEPAEEPLPQGGNEQDGDDETSLPANVNSTPEPEDDQGIASGDVVDDLVLSTEPVAVDVALPFDFEQLSEPSEELGEAAIAVELNLSAPASQESGWVVQAEELKPEKVPEYRLETEVAVSFAEQPRDELEGVQRLLSQMSQMQSDIRQESDALIAAQTEADFLAASYQESQQESAQVQQVTPQAEVVADTAVQAGDDTALAGSVSQAKPELEQPEPEEFVTPQTQPGGDEPPNSWQQQQAMGAEFQALFFEVNGVIFAVPLTELGGIHQLGDVNHLLGRPPWYLGLMTNREHQLDVVDTARWVMPEKLSSAEYQQEYRYIVMLGESKWGLACHALHGTETLTEQSVRWREKAGKRPWLAGMVKEKMCALIHVNELISMLNAGLDVKSVI